MIETLEGDEIEADFEAAWEAELMRRQRQIADGTATGAADDKFLAALRKKHS